MHLELANKSIHQKILVWTDPYSIEQEAQTQLRNLSELPILAGHIAVMPDVHVGKGATVGSVVATRGAIIPAAIGVDIGCGMMACKLPFSSKHLPDSLAWLRSYIESRIPVSHNSHKEATSEAQSWGAYKVFDSVIPKKKQDLKSRSMSQLGTLGGGNHFIEVCLDEEDNVWVMLHSGSRNIGKEVAEYFISEAKDEMSLTHQNLSDPNLAYLTEGTTRFDEYWRALQWLQSYAMRNRQIMMSLTLKCVAKAIVNDENYFVRNDPYFIVNCHHNYAEKETHFDQEVIVTRKGAVRAQKNDYGIIPGSMGTRSYIVKGLGNEMSYCSCSHGAGRRMSRSKAKEKLTLEDAISQTEGVECKKDSSIIDELPSAYKNIDEVMEFQSDLVQPIAILKQVLCVKG